MENSKNREEYRDIFSLANDFLDISQIRVNHPEHWKYYRDETKGLLPINNSKIVLKTSRCKQVAGRSARGTWAGWWLTLPARV
jgi:hypothetical protein